MSAGTERHGTPVIVGRRTFLRRPTLADRDEFLPLVAASRQLYRPWVSPPTNEAAFAAYVDRSSDPRTEQFFVCRRDNNALAAVFNLSEIVRAPLQSAYLGYYAFAPTAGQGLTAEGLELVLRLTFGPLKLHRIEANVQPGNHRSLQMVARAGFSREGFSPRYLKIGGRWRDHERWALLVEDWRRQRRNHRSS